MENSFFSVSWDSTSWLLSLKISSLIFVPLLVWLLLIFRRKFFNSNRHAPDQIKEVELTYKIADQEVKYKIERNFTNLEIAHRIYIELITRKAAQAIDPENDVISEVYNSWYALFQITREEIKKVSGSLLIDNQHSDALIEMTTDILNLGLRPHLTKYQSRFRKWYDKACGKNENSDKTAQEVQIQYPNYQELIESMKEVNKSLIDYSNQLKKFIKGK